jgi:DNA-binding response OmpR family regulator
MVTRTLLVDDDPTVRSVVAGYLQRAGHRVEATGDGRAAAGMLGDGGFDLAILDVMLPGIDGLSLLRRMREAGDETPVILLTARGEELDRVGGIELGADDYVVKPFSPRELVARAGMVLRRAAPPVAREPLRSDRLVIDPGTRRVHRDDEPIELTRLEFDLLHFLASNPQQVFSRAELLRHVWDSAPEFQDPSTVTVHVRRLRSKLEPQPDAPRWVVTARGAGYRFEP